jgi:BCD family chlorophyll transporter-like MFS transporter
MRSIRQKLISNWSRLGSRFLPFADAATPDIPLTRLLRLSLFQVSVGMALVMLIGTLNRVLIVELKVPVSLVSIMISIPLIFAPFRAVIGFRSDIHQSALGWKRVPYIWMGTLVQFGGFAIMPFSLLVLSGAGQSSNAPQWIGQLGAGFAFLLVGAGLHTTQTVGLALANDLVHAESQPKVVGLMYVMLLIGMIFSAVIFGNLLSNFSPGKLIQVVQGAAVATIILNVIALWKQEARKPAHLYPAKSKDKTFKESWDTFLEGNYAKRRLIAVGLGTMAFSMGDILLEPYGGDILNLTVAQTTSLTAALAGGGLLGFAWASRVLSKGVDPFKMSSLGALIGIPAFMAVIISGQIGEPILFALGTLFIGFSAGLFGHGTLTATMNLAPKGQSGLALGAWGAVQASAAGIAITLGGLISDLVAHNTNSSLLGYRAVYIVEICMLIMTMVAMMPLIKDRNNHKVLKI